MPSTQVETLLSGFKVDVSPAANGEGWVVTPGDVPVLSVKEVCAAFSAIEASSLTSSGFERENLVSRRRAAFLKMRSGS